MNYYSIQTFRRALTEPVDSCAEINSGVRSQFRVWRKVPESDAQGVLENIRRVRPG